MRRRGSSLSRWCWKIIAETKRNICCNDFFGGGETIFSPTYYNAGDNTFKTTISAGYLHYLASDGKFKDIDTNLRLDESGVYYIIDSALYNVAFAAAIGTGNWDVAYEVPRPVHEKFRDPGKPRPPVTRIRWKVLSYGYFDAQKNVYQILQNSRAIAPQAAASRIDYPQIFPDIDVRYVCNATHLKEEFVLSQTVRNTLPDPAKFGFSTSNSYFVVDMEYLLTPNNTKVLANRAAGRIPIDVTKSFAFSGDEPIDFEDESGVVPFFFQKDYAYALADSVTDFANRVSVKRVLYAEKGKNYLLVGVPWSWINQSPAGDLIIDPTTPVTTSDDVRLYDTGNYGSSAILAVGKHPSGGLKARTLIKFTLSGIPTNATVLRATMNLRYYEAVNFGGGTWVDRWVEARQVKKNWNEAQATKDKRVTSPDTSWLATYGALDGTDVASTYESNARFWQSELSSLPVWKNWDLTSLTQKWLNGATSNYGVMLWATNEDVAGYTMRFYSSEATPDSIRPKLEVVWSQTPRSVYFLKDHLGSIRAAVYDSANAATVIGYDDYDPWGYPLATRMKAIPASYLQGASKNRFTGKERDDEFGLNLDYFGGRYYDWLRGQWISIDPLANKYPQWSPYVYTLDNPILFIDPNGEETYVNSTGYVVKDRKILDERDPSVYLVQGDNLSKIGEVGGTIIVTTIFTNLLNQNMAIAAGIYDPSTFRDLVATGGAWDLKNLQGENGGPLSIFALGEMDENKTTYTFGEQTGLRSDDLGNIHYGATGLATGLFSEATLLREAGLAQIAFDYAKKGSASIVGRDATRPPYGDDPRDQKYINVGLGIQGHNPPSGLIKSTIRALTTAYSEHHAATLYKTYPGLRKP